MPISRENPKVNWFKISVGPKGWLPERLGWFLGVLFLMWKLCMVHFYRFHFLKVTYEVGSYHSNFSSHVYTGWSITWVDSKHGSPLRLDGLCVGHAFMLVARVPIILECLLHMHGVGHGYSDVTM